MLRARTSLLTVSRETNLENMSGGRMVAGAVVLCGWWTQRTAASLLHALSVWKDSALHFRELDRVAVQELRLGVRHFGEVCEAPRGCTIARVVLEPECSLHSRGARAVSRSRCDLQAQRSVQQTLAAGSKLLLKSVRAVRSRIEAHALEALVCHAQCSQSPRVCRQPGCPWAARSACRLGSRIPHPSLLRMTGVISNLVTVEAVLLLVPSQCFQLARLCWALVKLIARSLALARSVA
mmetsp:Transcript_87448/g.199856  ORF Transcript_87448/g.199856 Transcript_87448/m.199856 type:complete len:237 (-) Transcript_87448:2109-2819(-)